MNLGYTSEEYIMSQAHLGEPIRTTLGGTRLIQRWIPDTSCFDLAGPYPILCCDDWSDRHGFLGDVRCMQSRQTYVSLTFVADPLGEYDEDEMDDVLDVFRPFKTHYVVNLSNVMISDHHKRNIDMARRRVKVEISGQASDDLRVADWVRLYRDLIDHHNITNVAAFPDQSLAQQLFVPGATVFSAFDEEDAIVSMLVFYEQRDRAYYHLGASSQAGYKAKASFALFDEAIRFYTLRGFPILSLGGAAGLEDDPSDGLARFKRGWAPLTAQSYLCGAVLNREQYDELSKGIPGSYFPLYRSPTCQK